MKKIFSNNKRIFESFLSYLSPELRRFFILLRNKLADKIIGRLDKDYIELKI